MGLNENFYINDNRAYTEDNIIVYNIFVDRLCTTTTGDEILSYFQQFGNVVSVRILPQRPDDRHKKAFVNFKDPIDAANVLRNPVHVLAQMRLNIFACNSWHQPDVRKLNADARNAANEEDFHLLKLKDDCAANIFSYLDIYDQINLACCHERLANLFALRARRDFKVLKLEVIRVLTLWQTRTFLQIAGIYIERIEGLVPTKEVLKLIGIYCKNLKSLSFPDFGKISRKWYLTSEGAFVLFRNLQNLTDLRLNNLYLSDEHVAILVRLSAMRNMNLENNADISGRHIASMKQLETLSLNNCRGIQGEYFRKICNRLHSLKSLHIQNCIALTSNDIKYLVKHLRQVETLEVSCDNVYVGNVAHMPRLTSIHLSCYGTVSGWVFETLVSRKRNTLELLDVSNLLNIMAHTAAVIGRISNLRVLLCAHCVNLDDECLQEFSNLENLRELDISGCQSFADHSLLNLISNCLRLETLSIIDCRQISFDFYRRVSSLLVCEHVQGDTSRRLKIRVSDTHYNTYGLDQFKYPGTNDRWPRDIFECCWE